MADTESQSLPPRRRIRWKAQYRIIPTRMPLIDLFERLDLDEDEKRALWTLQARVNPRIQQELGNLTLVRPGDMLHGPHASIVMGAFTHTRTATRFSDGRIGIYYAARTLETAIRETVYHRSRYLQERGMPAQELHMRAWVGTVRKPCYDVRGEGFDDLHRPDDYRPSQRFARRLRQADPDAWGIVYRSVRHPGGDCLAALRPPAVSLPVQGPHLVYHWNGERITHVVEQSDPLVIFDDPTAD